MQQVCRPGLADLNSARCRLSRFRVLAVSGLSVRGTMTGQDGEGKRRARLGPESD
jgi:hypothetical protein